MILSKLKTAINERKRIEIEYYGKPRKVHPYLVGVDTDGNISLVAYQLYDESVSAEQSGWKMFLVDNIDRVDIEESQFQVRFNYNLCEAIDRVLFGIHG